MAGHTVPRLKLRAGGKTTDHRRDMRESGKKGRDKETKKRQKICYKHYSERARNECLK